MPLTKAGKLKKLERLRDMASNPSTTNKTIIICGYGVAVSRAVAGRFGAEGFQLALVARDGARLSKAADEFARAGVLAQAFPCDLSDRSAITRMIGQVRERMGPITVLHWNAYSPIAGDLASVDVAELSTLLTLGVTNLVEAVQLALPDLRNANGQGAVLITGGGAALYDPKIDNAVVAIRSMGVAVTKAAQHKLTGLLHSRLKDEGVYVGEVVIFGAVRGTLRDQGYATIEPTVVAERFWDLFQSREQVWSTVE
ncbi:SDR family NAD(P)-dependent oxidoreductase [Paraburkholderia pallida]|uniref:SDR family NAD(P)-dependent oxidoreductase n=1 Tax=Paraburkholderia pallida TaxID=2547399 RepID=A0A4P7DA81_9BURK|nr:SDR family NAD(P)-dependent oxidoreductase [Paraburkholderia pallida]QBR04327.1 SDR family NAD(P)-dependent oxidoreductase [Paraburkholderia pallida]